MGHGRQRTPPSRRGAIGRALRRLSPARTRSRSSAPRPGRRRRRRESPTPRSASDPRRPAPIRARRSALLGPGPQAAPRARPGRSGVRRHRRSRPIRSGSPAPPTGTPAAPRPRRPSAFRPESRARRQVAARAHGPAKIRSPSPAARAGPHREAAPEHDARRTRDILARSSASAKLDDVRHDEVDLIRRAGGDERFPVEERHLAAAPPNLQTPAKRRRPVEPHARRSLQEARDHARDVAAVPQSGGPLKRGSMVTSIAA